MKSDLAALWSSELWTVDCGGEHCQENTLREGEREREYWRGGQDRTGAANGVKWEPLVKSRAAGGGDG